MYSMRLLAATPNAFLAEQPAPVPVQSTI